jgi:hypothetical protein
LIRIQKENGINLKLAFQILEARLDRLLQFLGDTTTISSEQQQLHTQSQQQQLYQLQSVNYHQKRQRSTEAVSPTLVDRKIVKKAKLYKKRLREFQHEDDANSL